MAAAVQTQGIRIVRQLRTLAGHGIVQVKRLRPIADTLYRQCNLALTLAGIYAKGHLVDPSYYVHTHGTSPGDSVHLRDLLQFRIQQDYGILICLIAVRNIILPRQQGRATICIPLRCQPQDRIFGRSGTPDVAWENEDTDAASGAVIAPMQAFFVELKDAAQTKAEGTVTGADLKVVRFDPSMMLGEPEKVSSSLRTDNKTLLHIQCPIFLL